MKYDAPILHFACPGCGKWGSIICAHPKPLESPSWDIISVEPMTLMPSIHCIGCCGWHGYLKNGVFESC